MISFVTSNKNIILSSLKKHRFNLTYASHELKIPYRTFSRYIRELRDEGHKIPRSKYRRTK